MKEYTWPTNQFGENELDRILFLGIPESTPNYEALRRGAKKAVKKMIIDLIGDDDKPPAIPDNIDDVSLIATDLDVFYSLLMGKRNGRNKLRHELRKKVEEL